MHLKSHLLSASLAALATGLLPPLVSDNPFTDQDRDILRHMELIDLPDGAGGTVRTLRISHVNVQIVNGLGATNGYPSDPYTFDESLVRTNGTGNLILGYDEFDPQGAGVRTGSHNLVLGREVSHTGFGGVAAGMRITVDGAYNHVLGGIANSADGKFNVVVGGQGNQATGSSCVVAGGSQNRSEGFGAAVLGGELNRAGDYYGTVCGGRKNQATFRSGSVFGGLGNQVQADGFYSAIFGGTGNEIDGGMAAAIVGGAGNLSRGVQTLTAGGQDNRSKGLNSSCFGGVSNRAVQEGATVLGGFENRAGEDDPAATYPTVVGGRFNWAKGSYSVVGGGNTRSALGEDDWVAGSLFEDQ